MKIFGVSDRYKNTTYTMPVTAVSVKLMKIQTSFYCFIALAYR